MSFDAFKRSLERSGCSARTVRAYLSDLADVSDWLKRRESGKRKKLTVLSKDDLCAYNEYLRTQRRLGAATVRRRSASIRAYLRHNGRDTEFVRLTPSKVAALEWLSIGDEERLLDAAWRRVDLAEQTGLGGELLRARRNLAMVLLLLRGGLRAGELTGLRRAQLSSPPDRIGVAGRTVLLEEKARAALEQFLASRPKTASGDPSLPLFPGKLGEPLGVRTVQQIIAGLGEQAKLGRRVSPSLLRWTCAVRLHQAGVEVRDIARRLGMRSSSLRRRLPAARRARRRARTSVLSRLIPPEIRSCFDGFIGNSPVVKRLCLLIAGDGGTAPERTPLNVLFIGPPGCGKTELAERAARALGLPLLKRDGTEIRSRDQLIEDMLALARQSGKGLRQLRRKGDLPIAVLPPMAVFIDEIHAIPRDVVDGLLRLTEPNRPRHEGRERIIDATNVQFMGATTEFGQMSGAFENRFRPFELEPYSIAHVVEMLRLWYPFLPEEIYEPLALAGHLTPRSTRLLADEVANAIEQARRQEAGSAEKPIDPRDIVDELLEELGIDELGLSGWDRKYLGILCRSKGPVGIDRITNELGRREGQVTGYIEPFLLRLGFVRRSARGRVALENGRRFYQNPTRALVETAIEGLRHTRRLPER